MIPLEFKTPVNTVLLLLGTRVVGLLKKEAWLV
jgi:hypothetical protein